MPDAHTGEAGNEVLCPKLGTPTFKDSWDSWSHGSLVDPLAQTEPRRSAFTICSAVDFS